jgi:hypothetical protein
MWQSHHSLFICQHSHHLSLRAKVVNLGISLAAQPSFVQGRLFCMELLLCRRLWKTAREDHYRCRFNFKAEMKALNQVTVNETDGHVILGRLMNPPAISGNVQP